MKQILIFLLNKDLFLKQQTANMLTNNTYNNGLTNAQSHMSHMSHHFMYPSILA